MAIWKCARKQEGESLSYIIYTSYGPRTTHASRFLFLKRRASIENTNEFKWKIFVYPFISWI